MKWQNMRRTNQVEDRRNQQTNNPYTRMRGMGSSSSLLPLLLNLLLRSGRGKWVMLAFLAFTLFSGGLGNLFNPQTQMGNNIPNITQSNRTQTQSQTRQDDEDLEFLKAVLASTEDLWEEQFRQRGATYRKPKMVVYTGSVSTQGCGFNSAVTGPFYCPADETVYIDLSFYHDLQAKYQAPGDFAMAYVVAHEVGHHVQKLTGVMDQVNAKRARSSETQANRETVKLELQADYYAGVWAKYVEQQGVLDVGDIEEALQAAHAVGDDTLQEKAYGRVMPDSFTHGTSEQRRQWFMRGYQYGDMEHGNTFN